MERITAIICIYSTVFIDGLTENGWCDKYSRISVKTNEDIMIMESFNSYQGNKQQSCQWKLHFKNATKLKLEYEISNLPFLGKFVYNGYQGQISRTVYDILKISTDDCSHKYAIYNQTVQHTTGIVETDTICFQHFSRSKTYTNNRLQIRIHVTVQEIQCRDEQIPMATKSWCKAVCMPNNRTKEECKLQTSITGKFTTTRISKLLSEQSTNSAYITTTRVSHHRIISKGTIDPFQSSQVRSPHPAQNQRPYKETVSVRPKKSAMPRTTKGKSTYGTVGTLKTTTAKLVAQMTDQDVLMGFYIASTTVGVFTVIIIILLICCALKTKKVKKLTDLMYHISKSKTQIDNTRIYRQEFNDWSSVTSTLRPSLPPRPNDLQSFSDTRSTTVRGDEEYINENEEVYDNIVNINHHSDRRCTQKNDNFNTTNMKYQRQDLSTYLMADLNKKNEKREDETSISTLSQDSCMFSGEYIDSSSVKSHMYRKVKKNIY